MAESETPAIVPRFLRVALRLEAMGACSSGGNA